MGASAAVSRAVVIYSIVKVQSLRLSGLSLIVWRLGWAGGVPASLTDALKLFQIVALVKHSSQSMDWHSASQWMR